MVFFNEAFCFFGFFESFESECSRYSDESELCHLADYFEAKAIVRMFMRFHNCILFRNLFRD